MSALLFAVEIPYWGQTIIKAVLGAVAVLIPAGTIVYVFLFKMMSFMQSRLGPMEAGPYGSLQLMAEVGKRASRHGALLLDAALLAFEAFAVCPGRRPFERRQKAEVVVLACNGIGTPRLLLNSRSRHFPDGLANRSGLVGKNLMFIPTRWSRVSSTSRSRATRGRRAAAS